MSERSIGWEVLTSTFGVVKYKLKQVRQAKVKTLMKDFIGKVEEIEDEGSFQKILDQVEKEAECEIFTKKGPKYETYLELCLSFPNIAEKLQKVIRRNRGGTMNEAEGGIVNEDEGRVVNEDEGRVVNEDEGRVVNEDGEVTDGVWETIAQVQEFLTGFQKLLDGFQSASPEVQEIMTATQGLITDTQDITARAQALTLRIQKAAIPEKRKETPNYQGGFKEFTNEDVDFYSPTEIISWIATGFEIAV